ncbi:putative oxidoreductase-like protein [Erysiphe necator]|uniref:Putative oxidoreductase-like protein n=1 Tax=Uncinula necator TaxID=52586 RepID=A0A0B1PBG8_UNCNE|nr:putative oxidoreductase-like protein [Erysiphe necator]
MPVYRGIRLKIASPFDFQAYPEYPHPESSQFTYRSLNSQRVSEEFLVPNISSESKADSVLGRQPMASVYIQSIRGSHFWLRYNFEGSVEDKIQIYYLKLVVNGKCMKSWSVNARKEPEGQIKQFLYVPTRTWSRIQEKFSWDSKKKKIEYFRNSDKRASYPIKFNGLIEVIISLVPDRRNRKHRLPLLSEFKIPVHQDTFLGNDVLASSQVRSYLNNHPKSPKNEQFALFKFYCRDWDFIKNLKTMSSYNISQENSYLSSSTYELFHLAKTQTKGQEIDSFKNSLYRSDWEKNKSYEKSMRDSKTIIFPYLRKSPSSTNLRQTSYDAQVCKLSTKCYMVYSGVVHSNATIFDSETDIESIESKDSIGSEYFQSNHLISHIIPPQNSSTDLSSQHSRNTSSASNSFSITSSLISYEDKNFTFPELVEIGTAAVKLITDRIQ